MKRNAHAILAVEVVDVRLGLMQFTRIQHGTATLISNTGSNIGLIDSTDSMHGCKRRKREAHLFQANWIGTRASRMASFNIQKISDT
jgi:hypothetical protein